MTLTESYENKYKHKIKWTKHSRKCIFRISKKILEFNNYKSVRFIIYMNFVVQTAKNSNPLEVFDDMILLPDILYKNIVISVPFRGIRTIAKLRLLTKIDFNINVIHH